MTVTVIISTKSCNPRWPLSMMRVITTSKMSLTFWKTNSKGLIFWKSRHLSTQMGLPRQKMWFCIQAGRKKGIKGSRSRFPIPSFITMNICQLKIFLPLRKRVHNTIMNRFLISQALSEQSKRDWKATEAKIKTLHRRLFSNSWKMLMKIWDKKVKSKQIIWRLRNLTHQKHREWMMLWSSLKTLMVTWSQSKKSINQHKTINLQQSSLWEGIKNRS